MEMKWYGSHQGPVGIVLTLDTACRSAMLAERETWVGGTESLLRISATLSTISQTIRIRAECVKGVLRRDVWEGELRLTASMECWHYDMYRMSEGFEQYCCRQRNHLVHPIVSYVTHDVYKKRSHRANTPECKWEGTRLNQNRMVLAEQSLACREQLGRQLCRIPIVGDCQ